MPAPHGDPIPPTPEQGVLGFDDTWYPLALAASLRVSVDLDHITADLASRFDFAWNGETTFTPPRVPGQLPDDFGIGVVVGASGSGKSTILKEFGEPPTIEWSNGSIASHFPSADEAAERFYAVGLNSVPTWTKPYAVLSTGERFRADLARTIEDGAAIDEFTSVVDRNVAISTSNAVRRYVGERGLRRVVIATCHRDVLPWLQPDWVIDTDIRCWALRPRECLQRPDLMVEIHDASREAWPIFAPYHYLSADLHPFARCFVATMNDALVGFVAVLPFPNGHLRNAWRGHRTVVLPDYQGLGIGMRLSDVVAREMLALGRRFYSKTAHPRMVAYRDASPAWRRIGKTVVMDPEKTRFGFKGIRGPLLPANRMPASHEFVGP